MYGFAYMELRDLNQSHVLCNSLGFYKSSYHRFSREPSQRLRVLEDIVKPFLLQNNL